jgi:hypothetical protein
MRTLVRSTLALYVRLKANNCRYHHGDRRSGLLQYWRGATRQHKQLQRLSDGGIESVIDPLINHPQAPADSLLGEQVLLPKGYGIILRPSPIPVLQLRSLNLLPAQMARLQPRLLLLL